MPNLSIDLNEFIILENHFLLQQTTIIQEQKDFHLVK